MKRSALIFSLGAFGLFGCGDDGKSASGDTSNNSTSGITNITNVTTPGTSESGEPTTGIEPTGTGTGTTASTSDSSTTFDPNDCGEAVIDIPIVTPNVMLVLDKSGSMVADEKGYWDHDGDDADDDGFVDGDPNMTPATQKITRWKSLYGVVEFITTTFNNSMNLGMVLFPSKSAQAAYNASACPVNGTADVPIAPMNGAAILAAMPGPDETAMTIKGGTPAAKGVEVALAELAKQVDDQPKIVILVTDGAANCKDGAANNNELFEVYDETLPQLVADAFANDGIPTYVVGIAIEDTVSPMMPDGNPDNTNTFQRLNELADLGGVPRPGPTKFYDTQNEIELQAALDEIAMQILDCTIALNPVPKYPDYVEVEVAGTKYGSKKVTTCDGSEDGWMWVDETKKDAIMLCGKACSDFQMTGSLDAQYRCPNSG
ncbi:MAG TPA: hypothetical protein VIK91_01430 [Nannocystis sp.]